MWQVMRHPIFGRLFAAQVVALLGTGLLTVALGLLAFDLAGADAARVLGTAYTIKMVAYVGLSPVISALVVHVPRRAVLIIADILRATVALTLPFISEVWQIYLAIFLLQTASASFTPTFQATIPDVIKDEDDYAKALSLSRLAYDLESLISPTLAALLLTVLSYHWLFGGTVVGFLLSALLILTVTLPKRAKAQERPFRERLTRGIRIYLATPRLRGLLSVTLTAAAASAFVIVNTVVVVKMGFAGTDGDVALALAAFGGGSMLAAFALPGVLKALGDRPVMLWGAALLTAVMFFEAAVSPGWILFLALWALTGMGYAATVTPQGRLLRRSTHAEDRTAIFAAQFALSHACWLITYPLAGVLMTLYGAQVTMAVFGVIGLVGLLVAMRVWPEGDPVVLTHSHDDLPADHPHVRDHGRRHAHPFVIDDAHDHWPTRG
ncbi:MAG: MFS transporter [Pseudomonadota bacterium]